MPWAIHRRGDKYCVVKQGESSPVPGGCHNSKAKAEKHRRALYASEGRKNVSQTIPLTLGGASTTSGTSATFSNVTITISPNGDETQEVATEADLSEWEAVLALEGHETSDRRYLMPGEITERDLPQTLMIQTINEEGHRGAEAGGRIDSIWRVTPEEARGMGYELNDVPDDAIVIMASGVFADNEHGREGARLVDEEILRGISVDLAPTEFVPLNPETYEPVEEDLDLFDLIMGNFVTGVKAAIMGATVVPFAAFGEAVIRTLTASGSEPGVFHLVSDYGIKIKKPFALVASAAPLKPPVEWFADPQLTELTPLTITKEGRVYGHLADWKGCHTGNSGFCIPPPRSNSGYAYFNVGEMECAEGELINCGKIMFSMSGGRHAPVDRRLSVEEVWAHYDDTTCVGGYVKAGSDAFGTWVAGSLRPNLTEEEIQHIRLHPPSGDWRPVQGDTELVAALAVPIPGFPIPRAEAYLVASGSGEIESLALITPPVTPETMEWGGYRKRKRKKMMLQARLERFKPEGPGEDSIES